MSDNNLYNNLIKFEEELNEEWEELQKDYGDYYELDEEGTCLQDTSIAIRDVEKAIKSIQYLKTFLRGQK